MTAPKKENPPPGLFVSYDGHTRVVMDQCMHCGGARVMERDGKPFGVYVDDTTPSRRKWVSMALLHHPPPQIVFVGIGPDEGRDTLEDEEIGVPHVKPPQLIRLHEWIGWGCAAGATEPMIPWREFLPVRNCHEGNGYIQQFWWRGYYGRTMPNKTCRETVVKQMRSHKPRFIFKM